MEILGLRWAPENDIISFQNFSLEIEKTLTKRQNRLENLTH